MPGITPCMFPVNVFHFKSYATSNFGYALISFQFTLVVQCTFHTMPESEKEEVQSGDWAGHDTHPHLPVHLI
jgi:hypothetical protein